MPIDGGSMSSTAALPRVGGLGGAPKNGKTRLMASCLRGAPGWFGERGAYLEVDPDGAGSILQADYSHLDVWHLDPAKPVYDEMKAFIKTDWRAKGISTVIIDTGSTFGRRLLHEVAQLGQFGNNITISGIKHPTQGDYGAAGSLFMRLLEEQTKISVATGVNFWTIYHEQEVRPEPGKPGEILGGPVAIGSKLTKDVVGYYNTYLRMKMQAKKQTSLNVPREYERVVVTQTEGIWLAGLRTAHASNPIKETVLTEDPAQFWHDLYNTLTSKHKEQS